jgi:hypothetical protein
MTTQAWTSRVRHDSDATFREWGLEFSTKLAAVGLTQTADTGQVNWGTVTRPAANVNAGYEIWRFNDAAQATTPIFIRFDYGTGSQATAPRIQATVGSGSNGSGTITGTAPFTANNLGPFATAATVDTTYNSYMSYVAAAGAFGVFWKVGNANSFQFLICRDVDSSGTPQTDGAQVVINAQSFLTAATMRLSTGTITAKQTSTSAASLCLDPMSPGSSAVGADFQAYVSFGSFPRVKPVIGYCGVRDSEIPLATTFTVALVGGTSRTYIGGPNNANFSSTNALKCAMLWE